jgi:AhpD family alkylhydroperoxidase
MTLSESDKEFVAVGAAIGAGCHPCTQYHTQAALKAGLSSEQVLWAIDQAQAVRERGGVAVANVGRRILGVEQQDEDALEPVACRYGALVALGAADGCNSGVLLTEYAEQAVKQGLSGGELRETIDIAEMVKAMAGKFLLRDVERAVGRAPEAAAVAATAAECCAGQPSGPVEVPAPARVGASEQGSGCVGQEQ